MNAPLSFTAWRRSFLLAVTLLASACGGGGSESPLPAPGEPPPASPTMSTADAARFLRQASFGPTPADVEHLQAIGYAAWINEQIAMPSSLQLPYLLALPSRVDPAEGQADRMAAWFQNAITGPDQLRQRVAFALSEIMVVSDRSALFEAPGGLAYYYDVLTEHSFGNFRELMEAVTLTPAMGVFLSMLGNEKPDPARNIRPDENYAREMLQLFTIGLVELEPDGTVRLDASSQPIPTYDQSVVEGFAHVYTGWTFANSPDFHTPSFDYLQPMQAYPAFHATGPKTLLGRVTLPADQTPEEDLDGALDNIFDHPNVAPFISKQLIQRLVSANPTPEYVGRVSAVFEDNGYGERGNLAAVVRAILLDAEARAPGGSDAGGKLTEPLLRLTAVWRAYGARSASGRYEFPYPEIFFAQAPLRAPSVFNFFQPDYSPPGELKDRGLVSPEMQITTETTTASVNNFLAFAIYLRTSSTPDLQPDDVYIDIESELSGASDPAALVARTADRLLGGDISPELRAQATEMVSLVPASEPVFRVTEAIYAIAASPEFAVLQ